MAEQVGMAARGAQPETVARVVQVAPVQVVVHQTLMQVGLI